MERYSRLSIEQNIKYSAGSPVLLMAQALLKDNQNENIILQLKFKNITERNINALVISVKGFDTWNNKVLEDYQHQYLDLNISRDEDFGSKMPVILPNRDIRKCEITIKKVAFADGTSWESADTFDTLKEKVLLNDWFKDINSLKQYLYLFGEDKKFVPAQTNDLWMCSCGSYNKTHEAVCYKCHSEYNRLFEFLDEEKLEIEFKYTKALTVGEKSSKVDELNESISLLESLNGYKNSLQKIEEFENKKKDIILNIARNSVANIQGVALYDTKIKAYEKAISLLNTISGWKDSDKLLVKYREELETINQKIEDERIEQERQAEKSKRNKKTIMILVPIICIITAILVYLVTVVVPGNKYKKATAFMEAGNYAEAITLLEGIKGYKDSKDKLQNLLYKTANVGDVITIGSYQGSDIEWVVLEKQGDKALIISKYGLMYKEYNYELKDITWGNSTLKIYLNTQFINSSFTDSESSRILITNVTADRNPKYDTNAGNDIKDKLFLLSINEAKKYFDSDDARICYSLDDKTNACNWWLRSPGKYQQNAAFINLVGNVYESGYTVNEDYYAVRPAMWLNLE